MVIQFDEEDFKKDREYDIFPDETWDFINATEEGKISPPKIFFLVYF